MTTAAASWFASVYDCTWSIIWLPLCRPVSSRPSMMTKTLWVYTVPCSWVPPSIWSFKSPLMFRAFRRIGKGWKWSCKRLTSACWYNRCAASVFPEPCWAVTVSIPDEGSGSLCPIGWSSASSPGDLVWNSQCGPEALGFSDALSVLFLQVQVVVDRGWVPSSPQHFVGKGYMDVIG